MGSGDLTLGELLVSAFLDSSNSGSSLPERALPRQDNILAHSWQFVNWLLLGENGNSSQQFSKRAISLSNILLQYGQYSSLEVIYFNVIILAILFIYCSDSILNILMLSSRQVRVLLT